VVAAEAVSAAEVADGAGQAPPVADRGEPVPGHGEVRGSGRGVAVQLRGEPLVQVTGGGQPRVGVLDQLGELRQTLRLLVQQHSDDRYGGVRGGGRQLGRPDGGTLAALEVLDGEVVHGVAGVRGGQGLARHAATGA
jgi:hypothetical protein